MNDTISKNIVRRRRHGVEPGESLVEIVADHPVHVHEESHPFHHEIVLSGHRPADVRATLRGRSENEAGGARRSEGLEELQPDYDLLGWFRIRDRHAALADVAVPLPAIDRAGADRKSVV